MTEFDVQPLPIDPPVTVRQAVAEFGLFIASEGTLRSYPGSTHWHLRKPGVSGTLEVTWHPTANRLWVAYHDNRIGDGWVKVAAEEMTKSLSNNSA